MLPINLNCIFLTGMLVINFLGAIYPTDAQVTELSTLQANLDTVEQQLIGRWELRPALGTKFGKKYIVIFAPNGEYFELNQSKEAIRFRYTIDGAKKPPQVMIEYGIGVLTGTLAGSKMPIKLTETRIAEYSQFKGKVIIQARKLSADAQLPADVTVIEAAEHYQRQVNLARQLEAKSYLSIVNTAQTLYFIKYQRFASNLQSVAEFIGGDYQGEFYTYQLFLSDNGSIANIVAVPKLTNLKSYLRRITIKTRAEEPQTISVLCESEKPTTQVSSLPKNIGTKLQCPVGFRLK